MLDSIEVDPAHHNVVLENDQVRVVRWAVPVGDKTLNHSHPDNLNINLTDYHGRVTTPDGKTFEVHDKAGSLSWRQAGVHLVENVGTQPMEGILVEPKKPASSRPAGSADPIVADTKHETVEFENDRIRVIREHCHAGEKVAMHGHPDNVQVLLADVKLELTSRDGKTIELTGRLGDVRWRPATQHSARILDTPFEQIVVEMKGASNTHSR